ncbi:hypothetical protein ACA910_008873 [Epithemia clementina (nom. ined.)]
MISTVHRQRRQEQEQWPSQFFLLSPQQLLLCLVFLSFSSSTKTTCTAFVLHQVAQILVTGNNNNRPSEEDVTKVILLLNKNSSSNNNNKQPPAKLDNQFDEILNCNVVINEELLLGVSWRAAFVVRNKKDNKKDNNSTAAGAPETGTYLPSSFGLQRFERDGTFSNRIRNIFCLQGTYKWINSHVMELNFEKVEIKLLDGILPPWTISIQPGSVVRNLLERNIRGGKPALQPPRNGSSSFQKRPNIYSWCYVDDQVCVARGSSGSTALWIKDPGTGNNDDSPAP